MAGGTGDRSERHGGTTFLFRAMERRLGTVQEAHLDPSFVVHVQPASVLLIIEWLLLSILTIGTLLMLLLVIE